MQILLALFLSAHAAPTFRGTDFDSNRFGAIPPDTLYVAVFYDGAGSARVGIEVMCSTGPQWIRSRPITGFSIDGVATASYDLDGCEPSGRVEIRNVVPNGVVDGLAMGMAWVDGADDWHILKTNGSRSGQHIVGLWPLGGGSSDTWLAANSPGITNPSGQELLRTIMPGAVLLDNGIYQFQVH